MRLFLISIIIFFILPVHVFAEQKRPVRITLSELDGWQGLTADPEFTYNGLPAPKWDHSRAALIRTDNLPHDLRDFGCLKLAMHSRKATGAGFVVLLYSDNPETEGPDYYSLPLKIDWTGWKEFTIPLNEMVQSRKPAGWHKIDSLVISAEGWGNEPDPESVLHIADLQAAPLIGPSISDKELFDILDLEYLGLEKVKAAAEAGDLGTAKRELAGYLRNREKPRWKSDWKARPKHEKRPEGINTNAADRILTRDLPSVNVYHKFDNVIDWNLNPIDYREWPWQLNRHPFWVTLGRAYWATGEEKYAGEFVYQMTDWVRRCNVPRYTSGNSSYTWRTIETGIRSAGSWMESYHLFLTSPSFDDDAVIMMVKSFVEHARHLMKWPTSGNWLAMEANGLMHIGVMFPEFKEADSWRKTAAERLYAELDQQVYPDGAQIELSTGYHQVSLGNFIRAWEIAHLNDVPMPADYIAKIQKMFDYNLYASMPGGTLPGLNDANRTDIRKSLATALKYFPDRKDYEWVASQGQKGEEPKIGSIPLAYSGQLIMRSGWKPDSLYMLLDFGPFGYGHQHEDALSIVLYSHGKYHLVDAGNYPYDSSKWRKYVLSTRAHNTVMVDGLDQHRRGQPREQYVVSKPLPNKWASCKDFDYASGTYDEGYGPDGAVKVKHTRNVFFVKPEYWIVTDLLTPEDDKQHRCESIFHLDADSVSIDEQTKAAQTNNKESSNLSIIPLLDESLKVQVISGQEEPVVQGWMPDKAYTCRPIPTPVFEKEMPGPVEFSYVFYPTAAGEKCPIKSVEPLTSKNGSGMMISFQDGRVDYFIQSDKVGQKVTFNRFETDALAAWISMKGDKVVRACLAGGTELLFKGQKMTAGSAPIENLSDVKMREGRHR